MNDGSPHAVEERLHADCWRDDGERVELISQRCDGCGTHYLPHAMTCVECGGRSFTSQRLASTGKLYTYSIVCGAGGVWPEAYAVGYVDYPEGVRVFGQIGETEAERLRIGAPVNVERATLYRRKDGTAVTCFRFRPAEGDVR
jgi:uncharacterized OB-fold protein